MVTRTELGHSVKTNPDIRALIMEYLQDAKMMQLATVDNGKPWICNVWFAADKDLNIYWFSANTRRHSVDITKNPHVAAAICLPQTPADAPRGIQLEGTAELLTKPYDVTIAMKHYVGHVCSLKQVKLFMANIVHPHRFYRLKPSQIVLFDAANFPDDPRQVYTLSQSDN